METTCITHKELNEKTVEKVYSGKANKCCCGCSGKYSEPIIEELKSFNIILKKIIRALDTGDCDEISVSQIGFGDHVCITIGNRWYTAYFNKGFHFMGNYSVNR